MLKLEGISKTFHPGTADSQKVFDSLSLNVARGEFVTIIGANGAGKSTLFNIIAGTVAPDSGRVVLGGEDITFTPVHIRSKNIGRLFQDPMKGTAPGLSIEENLALAAGRGGWFSHISRADRESFRERLAMLGMGLEERMKQPVGLLSGGQRQALSLMMATFNPPKLLLLDEHTAALDPATAEKVMEITKRTVVEGGLTCLMITHNMSAALEFGDRTLMMDRGRIIFDTSGAERAALAVPDLLDKFRACAGREFDTDRVLLTEK
ncbi:MAG: ATP-binding cassette domain-containing protein [Clostridiales bacterium]|nr:ATP-binding cassette domain-containing protein [Clostridiales bacterium]